MGIPILATKLYIPPPRSAFVSRPRLIEQLNDGLHRKLTLVSAPAGFGKTTLVSDWIAHSTRPAAWLSLDEGDNDPSRFLVYVVAALQTIEAHTGEGVMAALQSPQPPPVESILTPLVNEITTLSEDFTLVLDDYHLITAKPVHDALVFLLEHLPPHMHLVIVTREDPHLPMARLRSQNQLTELRAADLRLTADEATRFLNQVMDLKLSPADIRALEARTEGWFAGLQLAAISMQGHQDNTQFIESFTGSHRFVQDYLIEEVLQRQPATIQTFLMHTSILDRLCGPLCDAVLNAPSGSGQMSLEYLERANLFTIALDNERRWYRYHHLFSDLLRQRSLTLAVNVTELHNRASQWYQDNGFDREAFYHAAAADNIDRAEYLMEGEGMPLIFRGAMTLVMNWLVSLPAETLDARPSLRVWYAFTLMSLGRTNGIEDNLQAAEAALQPDEPDPKTRDVIGRIAAIRSMMAIPQNDVQTMLAQSRRALAFLHPDNVSVRTATTWALGYAYHLLGDHASASAAYMDVISSSAASGNMMFNIAATSGLATLQEAENQLYVAAETYRRVLQVAGNPPLPHANGAYFGLAQIAYEWNHLDDAQSYGQQSLEMGRQIESIDLPALAGILLARIKLAQGDADGASAHLAEADQFVRQHNFLLRLPDIAAARVLLFLHQGDVETAADLARMYDLPVSQVRVLLAQGNAAAAVTNLKALRQQVDEKGGQDERLKIIVLQSVAYCACGEISQAVQLLREALVLAEPGGFVRTFIDEGRPMAELLAEAAVRGIMPDYVSRLLAAFETEYPDLYAHAVTQPLVEPLSQRELQVLQLVAEGYSNSEIARHLFIALDTVKGHNRRIYEKLQVQRRTEAVARARELGLL